jgi:VIT1/CCC1 family predicted Fe2+/Mn2+ transporter
MSRLHSENHLVSRIGWLLGAIGAKAGGADVLKATTRVTFWGAFAMALTAGIGALVGTAV